MGLVYFKDKPESDSFTYAYVETEDGMLVRVSIANMRKALGITPPVDTTLTLSPDLWVLDDSGIYYTQTLTIDDITKNSKVELLPTPEQIVQLMNDELTIFVGNENGIVTAYCINGVPKDSITFEIRITEVV